MLDIFSKLIVDMAIDQVGLHGSEDIFFSDEVTITNIYSCMSHSFFVLYEEFRYLGCCISWRNPILDELHRVEEEQNPQQHPDQLGILPTRRGGWSLDPCTMPSGNG